MLHQQYLFKHQTPFQLTSLPSWPQNRSFKLYTFYSPVPKFAHGWGCWTPSSFEHWTHIHFLEMQLKCKSQYFQHPWHMLRKKKYKYWICLNRNICPTAASPKPWGCYFSGWRRGRGLLQFTQRFNGLPSTPKIMGIYSIPRNTTTIRPY